jgi:hypothetical protein
MVFAWALGLSAVALVSWAFVGSIWERHAHYSVGQSLALPEALVGFLGTLGVIWVVALIVWAWEAYRRPWAPGDWRERDRLGEPDATATASVMPRSIRYAILDMASEDTLLYHLPWALSVEGAELHPRRTVAEVKPHLVALLREGHVEMYRLDEGAQPFLTLDDALAAVALRRKLGAGGWGAGLRSRDD